MGAGFEIEEAMVTTIATAEFGSLDAAVAGEGLRDRLTALRDETKLARKIETVKPILRASLDPAAADRLAQDLADYRRLRHLMAHRPSWLEGVWDPDAGELPDVPKGRTTSFRLFIADDDFVWEIDQTQGDEWSQLLGRCASGLDAARTALAPAPPAQALTEPVPDEGIEGEVRPLGA